MALLFGDSFDHYVIADVLKKWTAKTQYASFSMSTDYALAPHGQCLLSAVQDTNQYLEKTLTSTPATFVAGMWFRTPGSFAGDARIFAACDGATAQLDIRWDGTGHIVVTRNGTVLFTSTSTMSLATWYHIEFKATINSSTGVYEVRVNGSSTGWIPQQTGANTQVTANAQITVARIHGTYNPQPGSCFQDFYILDTTGSVANDFLGPCRFEVVRPSGAGNSAQWSGNYADNFVNVRDIQADGDDTFNQSSTAGNIDLFTMADVPSGTVHAIQHVIMARQDAGAARSIRPKTRISTTNYSGTTVATAAGYTFHLEPVSVSPATSAQWTDTEVNGAEFGYELVS